MGYEYGDAQNYAVRVFLNQVSKNFKYFDDEYEKKTLEYFDYKCPYTNEDISYGGYERDHIIGINRTQCGLHIYGNILLVTRKANLQKADYSLDEFLKDKPERLKKIQTFIEESGYKEIHNKYNKQLKYLCRELYNNTGAIVKNSCECFSESIEKSVISKPQPERLSENEFEQKKLTAVPCNDFYIKSRRGINYDVPSLSKQDILFICRKNGIIISGLHTKAAKNYTQNKYWANPNIENLRYDWFLTLDDYINRTLYCFKIPANSINETQIRVRADKPDKIDLQIKYGDADFTDTIGGLKFSKFLIKSIKY